MARRTIAERAAAGEIQSVQGLTREEQGELLVWARDQEPPIPYREIIRRFGFTQTEEGLRTWWRVITLNNPDRVPSFTATDVGLATLFPHTSCNYNTADNYYCTN